MSHSPAYVGAASRSGRAGIALPLEAAAEIATALVALMIMAISLAILPIAIFWHELCWATMIAAVYFWVRRIIRAYREGKS